MPAWVAWLAWRKMPLNHRPYFVTTMHGLNSVSRYSKIMTYGEKVIAVSNTVKSYILNKYPETQEDKIITIARGIDTKEFPFKYEPETEWFDAWFKEFPHTKGKWLITLPGRLTRLKGHNDFLDVTKKLKSENLSVHGLIVGGEDPKRKQYAEELYARVKSEGLEDMVTFVGYRLDMKEIYAISNAVLSLSTQPESFGRTAVEAISLGTPVIAYNHGGVGETMGQVYPAGLVSLSDIDETAIRCKQLYDDEIMPPLGELTVYSKQEMLDKTLALYDSLSGAN